MSRVNVDDKDKNCLQAEGLECLIWKKLTERDSEKQEEVAQNTAAEEQQKSGRQAMVRVGRRGGTMGPAS